jgi:addiction module RelE/StbE family toxin
LSVWTILETREAAKALAKAPSEIVTKYAYWLALVEQSGPSALRAIGGMHDEALSGEWAGFRSSRLNRQWRVIYQVEATEVTVTVVRVTPHDYRR